MKSIVTTLMIVCALLQVVSGVNTVCETDADCKHLEEAAKQDVFCARY
mgnify:CR=1 FL=1